jgi:uridine kinase
MAIFIRLLFITISTGGFAKVHYGGFLESFDFSIDPWTNWIQSGGRSDAFPYGLVLFGLLLMVHSASAFINMTLGIESFIFGYALILIICDLLEAKVLQSHSSTKASLIYMFSPLVIYVNFIYFQTDAFIGLFILMASVFFVQRESRLAGVFLGMAIGSKFGVVAALPFLLIYAAFNRRIRLNIIETLLWSLAVSILAYTPALWSNGFRKMVFGTTESLNLLEITIDAGGRNFYLYPAVYVIFCVWVYRNSYAGLQSVAGFAGCALFSLALFSEPAVGWFLWGISTMIYVGVFTKIGAGVIFYIVQLTVILSNLAVGSLHEFGYYIDKAPSPISDSFFTISLALGSLWTFSVLRETTNHSDPLALMRRPLSLAVGGDSGVGKDTLVNEIARLLGDESVTIIPGDGYHKHERGHLRWLVNTHLNPLENNLTDWAKDLQLALRRRDIYVKNYDHSNGRFEYLKGNKPRDLIISQGLHALYERNSEGIDVKLFLEMQEEIRIRYKKTRDTKERKHSVSKSSSEIKRRRRDFKEYIGIQKAGADIIIRQQISKKGSQDIDTISVETKNDDLADFIYNSCAPVIELMEYRKVESQKQILTFRSSDLIDSQSLKFVLEGGFIQFNDYFPRGRNPHKGSVGLIAVLTLLSIFYKRTSTNEF